MTSPFIKIAKCFYVWKVCCHIFGFCCANISISTLRRELIQKHRWYRYQVSIGSMPGIDTSVSSYLLKFYLFIYSFTFSLPQNFLICSQIFIFIYFLHFCSGKMHKYHFNMLLKYFTDKFCPNSVLDLNRIIQRKQKHVNVRSLRRSFKSWDLNLVENL